MLQLIDFNNLKTSRNDGSHLLVIFCPDLNRCQLAWASWRGQVCNGQQPLWQGQMKLENNPASNDNASHCWENRRGDWGLSWHWAGGGWFERKLFSPAFQMISSFY